MLGHTFVPAIGLGDWNIVMPKRAMVRSAFIGGQVTGFVVGSRQVASVPI